MFKINHNKFILEAQKVQQQYQTHCPGLTNTLYNQVYKVSQTHLPSLIFALSPWQVKFSMYPRLQFIRAQSGWHTAMKWGRSLPMEYLAMSVNDWLAAAPKMKVPMAL